MRIQNWSSQTVLIELDGRALPPLPSGTVCAAPSAASVTLHHEKGSFQKWNDSHLAVQSRYQLSGVSDDTVLHITREKIRFDIYGLYDRFMLSPQNAAIMAESFDIQGKSKAKWGMIRHLVLDFTLDFFIFDPIAELGLKGPFLLLAGLVVAGFIWGFQNILLILLGLWLAIALLSALVGTGLNLILRSCGAPREFHESRLKQFARWCRPDQIAAYYASAEREPLSGQIER